MAKAAASVPTFLDGITNEQRREDARKVCALMQELTGEAPKLHGSMVGFGKYHYVYESGREGDTFVVGFAPRKTSLVLYLDQACPTRDALLAKLGEHEAGVGCVYVKRLSDVDEDVLRELITDSVASVRARC